MQMDKLLLVTHQISETSYGTVQDSNAWGGGGMAYQILLEENR